MVDRFALHLDERVVARFEIDLFGQVFEDPGGAALRMGSGEDAQRLTIRQVPEVRLRIECAIDGKRCFLPAFPVELVRQLLGRPQALEQLAIVRPAFEKGDIEFPECHEGLIVELQPALAVEDGDRRGEMVERLGMALQRPVQLGAHRLDIGHVDGHAGRAAGKRDVDDIEECTVAMHDR